MDAPEHVYQLIAPGLEREFPPLRHTAATPLETLEHGDDFDARIDRATKAFERRITDWVADNVERALEARRRGRRATTAAAPAAPSHPGNT